MLVDEAEVRAWRCEWKGIVRNRRDDGALHFFAMFCVPFWNIKVEGLYKFSSFSSKIKACKSEPLNLSSSNNLFNDSLLIE